MALSLCLGWLIAGDGRAADRAFLEADRLDPAIGLVPDPWGLWPALEGGLSSATAADLEPIALFHRWRWLDPGALEQEWKLKVRGNWREALTPEGLDGLALLVRQREVLGEPLEPFLAQLVPEAEIKADPGQALCFWGFLCDLCPDWGYARLKAAELAFERGEQAQSLLWLQAAPEADHLNPWFWDVRARQALGDGDVTSALEHWGEALRRVAESGSAEAEALAELFRQRRREARRGPGLLKARSLLNQGEATAARQLLEALVAQDPQWQPLRSLLEASLKPASAGAEGGDPTSLAMAQLQRFAALLERTAADHGLPLPGPADRTEPLEAATAQATLQQFAAALAAAEARFALAA